MLPGKTGWNNVFVCDEILRGYTYEMQDFVESVAYNKKPKSGIELAYESTKVLYAAYQAADEQKTIFLN